MIGYDFDWPYGYYSLDCSPHSYGRMSAQGGVTDGIFLPPEHDPSSGIIKQFDGTRLKEGKDVTLRAGRQLEQQAYRYSEGTRRFVFSAEVVLRPLKLLRD